MIYIKIKKCTTTHSWYKNEIGNIYKVIEFVRTESGSYIKYDEIKDFKNIKYNEYKFIHEKLKLIDFTDVIVLTKNIIRIKKINRILNKKSPI